ncbi:c-type cytochrome biogenesis protein CcmI [Mesorhizobium sp. LHD-90]|uniref:c-type cytochrome biogenesis protein CcmI n=1 Tax=Mesorhizobium sp. LHD-90 TaxID=3071414 RepID=UPI0027DFDBCA|nr:c-type cytochrome biogenesis protein CcmI [Mesorhizobium sp. LHD-90]MDQ6436899.1 c-type cytochrome biogenesis protein CcmI [Mesorhizobium sp. LHD-90]
MLFWIVAALLTLAASLAVMLPLSVKNRQADIARDHDIEVYRDQLGELDKDAARGLIGPAEAEEARAEIGRRILKLAGTKDGGGADRPARLPRVVGAAAVLAVPIVGWGLYAELGSPLLPGQPLNARLQADPAENTMEELVARAEAHLSSNPEDGRGWDVLAPIYLRTGRSEDSAAAYRNAIRLLGGSADRLAGLGEALSYGAGGVVTAEAQDAFKQALAAQPDHPKSRFYLASGLAQEGKLQEAAAAWQALLGGLPADSPWRGPVQEAITEANRRSAAVQKPAGPVPTQEEMDAAASMTADDRTAMIEQMVSGLDAKLRENPKDVEGWMRLVRSYVVLGKADQAREALGRGLAALDSGSEDGKRLTSLAASLGLASTE